MQYIGQSDDHNHCIKGLAMQCANHFTSVNPVKKEGSSSQHHSNKRIVPSSTEAVSIQLSNYQNQKERKRHSVETRIS